MAQRLFSEHFREHPERVVAGAAAAVLGLVVLGEMWQSWYLDAAFSVPDMIAAGIVGPALALPLVRSLGISSRKE